MITASIVTYNTSGKEVEILINSVLESPIIKLYIIDNSPKNSLEYLGTLSPKIEYHFGHGNIGFGAAHNIAIKSSIEKGAKYHLILNPDIHFEESTIDRLLEYMDKNEEVGLIMPKVIYPNGELQYLCKLLPTPMDWIGRRFIPFKKYIKSRNTKYELRKSGYNNIMNIPYLSGCFMLFRNNVLKEIGLFDEKIFMYGEDTDITRRIHKKYKTIFFPDAKIIHIHNKESYRNYKLLFIHIRAAIYYFNKWGWFFDKDRKKINQETLKQIENL